MRLFQESIGKGKKVPKLDINLNAKIEPDIKNENSDSISLEYESDSSNQRIQNITKPRLKKDFQKQKERVEIK